MFGYVMVNKPELKIREMEEYRMYYCSLCRTLKEISGVKGQLSLSYDMTFLAVLLSGLYEPEETKECRRCMIRPFEKHTIIRNELISYVADMTLLLTWYKCRDDALDENSMGKAFYAQWIHKKVREISCRHIRQAEAVDKYMQELSTLEKERNCDIDRLSGCFGHLLGEIFAMKEDEWQNGLWRLGFYIGKFIYILDGYDDLERDRKKHCFNPFIDKADDSDFDEYVKCLLMMAATELAKEFEKLPVLKNAGILRNIIYSGIWTRYEQVREKRIRERKVDYEKSV